jgi:hypothetical protein
MWSLDFSFKIFYTFGLNINFFPPNINTSCPVWYCYLSEMPSKCPSLTLQMIYPLLKVDFIKEAACC